LNRLITNNPTSNFYNKITSLLKECKSFYFNVAFINFSGVQLLLDSLRLCEKRGVKGKILSSTYLNFTQVKALEKLNGFKNIELKIFDCSNSGFHPKAYIFEFENEYKSLVGSSNITSSAFKSNIEWNIKTILKKDDMFFKSLFKEFNALWKNSFFVNKFFLQEYGKFQKKFQKERFVFKKELFANHMQKQALKKLEFLRKHSQTKALAIAATGSGKTHLSLLDIKSFKAKRVLFVVHRENILIKAKNSFKQHFSHKKCGLYTGNKKEKNSDFIFSTIQTLNSNYQQFSKVEFDYIVVDEAHHIASISYKKIYEYFEPKFLLGLTATPTRSDGISIYEYFDENIACDIRLNEALENKMVSNFHYYGIRDITINLQGLDLNKVAEVSKVLMLNKRVDFILEKINFYGFSGNKRKALGFCVCKEHALFMANEFNKKGYKSISLDSSSCISKREEFIKKLQDESDELEFIFSVDIFNEGIDIPCVNLVLMLRPTNSPIVFAQQLGRGLRRHKSKEFLTLLDFIGNHNKTYLIALALIGNKKLDKDSVKLALYNNFANISNAHIIIDEISKKEILTQIEKENFNSMKYLKDTYFEFKAVLGKIPKLVDFINYDEQITPYAFIDNSKSYVEFLIKVEKKDEFKILCEDENFIKAIRFIDWLLPIKRVYEFVILKYLLEYDFCNEHIAYNILQKYLKRVDRHTIKHCFEFLNQNYFDNAQKSRFLRLVKYEDFKVVKTQQFSNILRKAKEYIEDSLNYGILTYEEKFGIDNFNLPFLKLYEKYNMLNIAQLCNFNKIHSSFRGSGFLKFKDDFFLFITIEKNKFTKGAKYSNAFLSNEIFTYSSKPSHSQQKGDGLKLINNKKYKVKLHIFVRKFSHIDKKVQLFSYLGLANTIEYKNNKPIDLKLKLENPLPKNLFEEFTKVVSSEK